MNEVQKLKKQRERLGMTQKEIAKKLYCSRVTYTRWENGQQSPQPIFIMQIQKLLINLERMQPTY